MSDLTAPLAGLANRKGRDLEQPRQIQPPASQPFHAGKDEERPRTRHRALPAWAENRFWRDVEKLSRDPHKILGAPHPFKTRLLNIPHFGLTQNTLDEITSAKDSRIEHLLGLGARAAGRSHAAQQP